MGRRYFGATVSYEPEALALFARMDVQPDRARKGLINKLIKSLKSAEVWAKIDGLYILAAHDSQAARLNWKSVNFTLTAVNNPVFTVDRGYQGNGSSQYLSTGYNFSGSGGVFTQNSGTLGVWTRTTDAVGGYSMGNGQNALAPWSSSGSTTRGAINAGSFNNFGAVPDAPGLYTLSRTASNLTTNYKDGVASGTATTASSALQNNICNILAYGNSSYTNRQLAASFLGAGLSAVENLSVYIALATYMTAVGA